MTELQSTDFVIEPEKRVPVAAAVDVAVAGGGISGMSCVIPYRLSETSVGFFERSIEWINPM